VIEIVATQGKDILALLPHIKAESEARQVEILSQFPGMNEKFATLGNQFQQEMGGLHEFFKKYLNSFKRKTGRVVLALDSAPEIKYPSHPGLSIEEAREDIRLIVGSPHLLEVTFLVKGEEYSEIYAQGTIEKILNQGRLKAGLLIEPSQVILSKGPFPQYRSIEKFRFLRKTAYSCGGITNNIAEYEHLQTGLEFVLVPGGSFEMGSHESEEERWDNEGPLHTVVLQPFLMSKQVVTQGVWKKIMQTEPWLQSGQKKKGWRWLFKEIGGQPEVREGEKYPALNISWQDATEFCQKAGLQLPSEAQWEYACRAGTTTTYYWGNDIDGEYCWYDDNTKKVGENYAHEVGDKKPNAFGLYDMLGNIWEWCEDTWHKNYIDAPGDGSVWVDSASNMRVSRGGGWNLWAGRCRTAYRGWSNADFRSFSLGLRLVKTLE
jgi:formylglycine-generating enzyme required for sulfatase activity